MKSHLEERSRNGADPSNKSRTADEVAHWYYKEEIEAHYREARKIFSKD